MAINKVCLLLLCLPAVALSREAAPPAECQTVAAQPPLAAAKARVDQHPGDLRASVALADAWSDAGCFNDALQVLQGAAGSHPGSDELTTRIRVARSLVGEERYFDNLDRADADARHKRDVFRCSTLADVAACDAALRRTPTDPALLAARSEATRRDAAGGGDMRSLAAQPTADTSGVVASGTAAAGPVPRATDRTPPAQQPPVSTLQAAVRYSNQAPESQSH